MSLVAAGFNYKNTPLDILGKIIIPEEALPSALEALNALPIIRAAVILSTCNRCEIYADIEHPNQNTELTTWLLDYAGIPTALFSQYGISCYGEDAIVHLMRVASSIDSMIVGEPQILGQVKAAYTAAVKLGYSNSALTRWFEKTFSIAKQARSQTNLGKYPVSYASAVLELAQRIFSDLASKQVLFIGTGEMIALTAGYFHNRRVDMLTIAGRSLEKAQVLARQFDGDAIQLTQIKERLPHYDIIVSCTASEQPILSKIAVEQAMKQRRHRPICIADIALPCDVESTVETLEDVYLYPLEKLANIIDKNQETRLQAARQVEAMITAKVHEYFDWDSSQKISDTITLFNEHADTIREKTLCKTLDMLENGKSTEEALTYLSTTLTNRLMHIPIQTLKYTAEQGQFELLAAIKRLLEQSSDKQ